jgi:presequence protease
MKSFLTRKDSSDKFMNQMVKSETFELVRSQPIASLNALVEEYRHIVTGAQHIHIASESEENVFLVALRTVPEDSSGVAHILEHTALCGSERYPVRDPFFMMIRRSLNTFMNAMTSSDWTAYPFASQNRKDYFNLLDVYLDAVFFSRLDPLDFAQEGHRLEFSEPDNDSSALTFKGVVFNEMKGAMSSVTSTLWHTLTKYLYPTTTYHYNSGGEPEHIPDLSYNQLLDFYKTHYHPSNAVFMTFGNIPAADLQTIFEDRVLKRFQKLDIDIEVPDEKRYLAPIRVEEAYSFDEEGESDGKTHVVLGWLLGKSTDLMESMEAHLLSSVLLDNSASPLLQALETTELGSSPSPLCGLDDSQKELCFVCGIEGTDTARADDVEALVLEVLKAVVKDGIPHDQLAASLHQLELQQREITGDGYPYGLHLLMTALTNATHRGDPIALLDLDPVLAELRTRIENPDYIKTLARNLLLENQHRVRLVLRPDKQLSARKIRAEQERLSQIARRLSAEDKQRIISQAAELKRRQARVDDETILPKVGLEDVQRELAYKPCHRKYDHPGTITTYDAGTNGLVYQQFICQLPELDEHELMLLPLYSAVLTELGIGNKTYLETQLLQSRVCGSIHGMLNARGTPTAPSDLKGFFTLSAKGLHHNYNDLTELMLATLETVRFDEHDRLRDLIAQRRARMEKSITGNGHSLAMGAAAAGIGPGGNLSYRWHGLEAIRGIKKLDDSLGNKQTLSAFAGTLSSIHQKMISAPRQVLTVGEEHRLEGFINNLEQLLPQSRTGTTSPFHYEITPYTTRQLWKTSTQVNFCARAYPTVASAHPDAATLTVLGGFLRNGFLHTAIREQGGAYGGGASQDSINGSFRFFSYRDPRMAETLSDFDASLDWLQSSKHQWSQLEEAILGVISAIDKPASPAGEAKQTFHAELFGNTREIRETFRQRVLEVTLGDLQRVASTYLTPENANTTVITNQEQTSAAGDLGLEVMSL